MTRTAPAVPEHAAAAATGRREHGRGRRPRLSGSDLGWIAAANAVVVVGLWWRAGGLRGLDDAASIATSVGRVTGLLGAYLVLVQLLLLGRIPALDRAVGFDRLAIWHRRNGHAALILLAVHTVLITVGYALSDRVTLPREVVTLLESYPGVLTATAGLVMLIAVAVTSVAIARRRLRYETWYFVHLYAYLGIALAFSHQLATGHEFVHDGLARAYWYALYVATLGTIVVCRLGIPAWRALRHRMRVEAVVPEGPGVVSLVIGGARLDRLPVAAGQFFLWRFLTRDRWWEAHPFSLSAAPDGRTVRITVKALGDFTAGLASVRPGTRVVAEGPYGSFTSAARRRPRAALIAGGVGIAPIRALLEDAAGELAVVYRAVRDEDLILRKELEELAARRGIELHYVLGDHRAPAGAALLSPDRLLALVPDIAERDVFVCGPPGMIDATEASLRRAGVPRRRIVSERFAY